jgi:hypothetical protein
MNILKFLAPLALLRLGFIENDAPDTSRADAVSERIASMSEEQFAWVKQKYEESEPERRAASERAGKVSDAQLRSMESATAMGEEYAGYNRGVFRPLERQIVSDAQGFDSADRQEAAAGKASTDVTKAFGAAAADTGRDMARMGINPADGAYADMQSQREVQQALAVAGAENRAREQVQTVGRAMRSDAANMGRGLPSAQATQASLALNAGDASTRNILVPGQVTNQGVQMVSNASGQAVGGLSTAGNLMMKSAELGAQGGTDWNSIGQIAGAGVRMYTGMGR